jgi:hypothetical protein
LSGGWRSGRAGGFAGFGRAGLGWWVGGLGWWVDAFGKCSVTLLGRLQTTGDIVPKAIAVIIAYACKVHTLQSRIYVLEQHLADEAGAVKTATGSSAAGIGAPKPAMDSARDIEFSREVAPGDLDRNLIAPARLLEIVRPATTQLTM